MKHATSLEVFMGGEHVGTLVADTKGKIWFAYGKEWSAHGFGLSPMRPFSPAFAGALDTSAFKSKNDHFDGLHGVFNDSLPDGWGLLLMDRVLEEKLAWERHAITPLDRLSYIGGRAMGALEYRPAMAFDESSEEPVLSSLAEAALSVQEGSAGKILESLRIQGGSPGGASPKVTVALNKDGTRCMSGFSSIPADFDHWIVKFRAEKHDPPCIGRIEKAYAEMASQAGITMPEARLVTVRVRGKPEKSGVADCDEMLRRAHDAVSGWPSVAEAHGVAKRLANDYGRRMRNGRLRKELDSLYAVRNTRAGRKGPESGPTI